MDPVDPPGLCFAFLDQVTLLAAPVAVHLSSPPPLPATATSVASQLCFLSTPFSVEVFATAGSRRLLHSVHHSKHDTRTMIRTCWSAQSNKSVNCHPHPKDSDDGDYTQTQSRWFHEQRMHIYMGISTRVQYAVTNRQHCPRITVSRIVLPVHINLAL